MAALAPAYRPRRPTETVLYGVVRDHLETFLAHARETYEAQLPRYVEHELRGYLRGGVLAHGFVRAHCDTCGHDLLVVNLNVHFHSMVLDGVFTRDQGNRIRFHPAPAPTREELGEVVRRVHRRALAWLARSKLLDTSPNGQASQESGAQTTLDACAMIAMQRGAVRAIRDDPTPSTRTAARRRPATMAPSSSTASTCTPVSPSRATTISAAND